MCLNYGSGQAVVPFVPFKQHRYIVAIRNDPSERHLLQFDLPKVYHQKSAYQNGTVSQDSMCIDIPYFSAHMCLWNFITK